MKRINFIFSVFILIVHLGLTSCNKKKEITDYSKVKKVNLEEKNAEYLDFSQLVDSISFLPIETNSECLISELTKVYFANNDVIVFDSNKSNIFIFNRDGKYKTKVGIKGGGPNEYEYFNDIYFDKKTSLIYAFERYLNKMYIYDLSGKLVKQIHSKFAFNSFCKSKNGYWIYSCFKKENPEGYNLMHIDESMQKMTSGFFSQNSNFINAVKATTFYSDNSDNHFFVYPTSDIIYQLEDDKPVPYIQFDFKDKRMPYERISEMSSMQEYDKCLKGRNYMGGFENFHFVRDKMLFNFRIKGSNVRNLNFLARLNLTSMKLIKYKGIKNTMPLISSNIVSSTNDALIFLVNPAFLTNKEIIYLKENGCKSVNSDSNPVLLFYYISKNF
jgi:hypothetical protein